MLLICIIKTKDWQYELVKCGSQNLAIGESAIYNQIKLDSWCCSGKVVSNPLHFLDIKKMEIFLRLLRVNLASGILR